MKMLNQEEAKRICDKVMSLSKADECRVQISGSRNGNIRYARNAVSTAGLTENTQLTVSVAFGKRQGTASINEFDDKALERAVRRAEDVARLAPENPEFLPAIKKQEYKSSATYNEATAAIDPEYRAEVAAASINACRKQGLVAAGFFSDTTGFETIANSNGVFGHQTLSNLGFTITTRTEDGRGSGWATRSATDAKKFDAREASEIAIEKALKSVDAKALEPGRYTVILEPAATSEIIGRMFGAFDARRAEQAREIEPVVREEGPVLGRHEGAHQQRREFGVAELHAPHLRIGMDRRAVARANIAGQLRLIGSQLVDRRQVAGDQQPDGKHQQPGEQRQHSGDAKPPAPPQPRPARGHAFGGSRR